MKQMKFLDWLNDKEPLFEKAAAWPFPTGTEIPAPPLVKEDLDIGAKWDTFPEAKDTSPEADTSPWVWPTSDQYLPVKVAQAIGVHPSAIGATVNPLIWADPSTFGQEHDPFGLHQNTPGAKLDAGKPRTWLFLSGFSNALEAVAEVTTVGANKYTPNGWAEVENGSERYMDAFGRHLIDLGKGNWYDDDKGGTMCLHKAQMIWNLLASLELDLRNEDKE